MKKILVVIDMQNDFIDGPLGTPEARAIVPNVCAKIREGEWDSVYTTHDVHFEDYLNSQEGQKLPIKHCIHGTDGQKLNESIRDVIEHEYLGLAFPVFKKYFGSQCLHEEIRKRIFSPDLTFFDRDLEIHVVGVCTDICVITNVLLLKTYFPEARIVVDASCCAGTIQLKHWEALDVMRSCQIDIVNEGEIEED